MSMFIIASRRRHTRYGRDWSSDVCSSDLAAEQLAVGVGDIRADHYGVGPDLLSPYPHAAGLAFGDDHLLDGTVQVKPHAELGRESLHRFDQRVHPALGEPETVLGELDRKSVV